MNTQNTNNHHPLPDATMTGELPGWQDHSAVIAEIRRAVADRLRTATDTSTTTVAGVVDDQVSQWVRERASEGVPPPSPALERQLAQAVVAALSGLGGLVPLLAQEDVENIHIHGCDRVWLEHADGRLTRWPEKIADSDAALLDLITAVCARHGQTSREWSPAHPLANLRIPEGGPLGARLAALREVIDRPRIAIRRHRLAHTSLTELHELGTLSEPVRHLLATAVAAGVNVLATGGPAAGKTALLRALCHEIPAEEHVVTVEDDYELGLHLDEVRHPLVTAAEARTANAEGIGEISLDTLLTQALRHSPSRAIVGEVRGGEITSLLRALGNGAAGGMGTLHAASARAVPDRIAALAQLADPPLPIAAAHRWTASALDLLVHVTRRSDPATGTRQRVVSEVVEVGRVGDADVPDLTTLAAPDIEQGRAVPVTPPSPALLDRLEHAGLDRTIFHHSHLPTPGRTWAGDRP